MEIGLLGMGVVGGGVWDILQARDMGLKIKRVLDLREIPGLDGVLCTDMEAILADAQIGVVAEAMGGLHPAYEYVMAALGAGKHVVTSNKALVSHYYQELHQAAAENGVQLRYSAAAGGGIPWLHNLSRVAECDEITELYGILNGTTNFILDAMTTSGAAFDEALREAQRLGYAEADPSADIDGLDAQRKCAISASLAFGGVVREADIPVAGIRNITAEDVAFCAEQGYVCRLLVRASRTEKGVAAYVEPTLVEKDAAEAGVHGCFNRVTLIGRNFGSLSFMGQGAGKEPTGSAVVRDILDIALGAPTKTPCLAPLCVENGGAEHTYFVRQNGRRFMTDPMPVARMHKQGADFFAGVMCGEGRTRRTQ